MMQRAKEQGWKLGNINKQVSKDEEVDIPR